jgi:FAD/FMN-containing dehydrogenase
MKQKSYLSEKLHDQLVNILGKDHIKTDHDSLQTFGRDWTCAYTPDPLAIVFPTSIGQVQAIVKLAIIEKIPLVPSGGRTGLSGGAVVINKELVVSFDKMNKIVEFDAFSRTVKCQAGVITAELQKFADEHDLYYPVDFASSGSSQIGGNISTNAGGIKVMKYGMTRQWVAGLTVVTGQGDILDLNHGLQKNNPAYDLRQLFIGA